MLKLLMLIYLIIFVISFWVSAAYRYSVKNNPAQKFLDECKNVIAPQCQQYILKASYEKKYKEVVTIQQERIRENERILKYYKMSYENFDEKHFDELNEIFKIPKEKYIFQLSQYILKFIIFIANTWWLFSEVGSSSWLGNNDLVDSEDG